MKIGFIGGGRMGEALLVEMLRTSIVTKDDIKVSETNIERRQYLSRQHGVFVTDNCAEVLTLVDVVVLAVKPQGLDVVLRDLAPVVRSQHLIISIVAGKHLAGIESMLPETPALVRVMPNLPALVSKGISAFCCGSNVDGEDKAIAELLLRCFGDVIEMDESQFDAITALSGSGPAFFAYFLEAMVCGGVALGIERKDAERLALQTMLGTAEVLVRHELSAFELMDAVASKGGTTEAGLIVLNESTVNDTILETLRTAARRSCELSGTEAEMPPSKP